MSHVVGIDAGGSGVTALAEAPDGSRRSANGNSANLRVVGIERAADAITQAIDAALQGASASAIVVGAAGVAEPRATQALHEALQRRYPDAAFQIHEDAYIALRAALPQGDGLLLVAGTGSIAYARIGEQRFRVGGHGYLVGDEGSGFSIGSAAARLLLRAYDGRTPQDPFLTAVAAELGVENAAETVAHIYGAPAPVAQLAALAKLTIAYADAGERSATKIVQAAALELFDLIKALVRRADVSGRALPLVFAGGLLMRNSLLSYLIETRVSNELPQLIPHKNVPAPVEGALTMAKDLLATL